MKRLARGMQCLRLSEALESGDVSSPESQRRLRNVGKYLDSVCKVGRDYRIGIRDGFTSEDYEVFFNNHQELFDFLPGIESGDLLSYLNGHVARIEHILKTGSVDDSSIPLRIFLSRLGSSYIGDSIYDVSPGDNGLLLEAQDSEIIL